MKKTGILTLSMAQNYGAVLQSFSLQRYIQNNYGDVEIIKYIPTFIIGRYKLFRIDKTSMKSMLFSVIKGLVKLPFVLETRIRFVLFRNNYCVYSKKKYVKTICLDNYELYLVGSDQVFNLELTKNEETFFLPFVTESSKKVTYAASIGLDEVSNDQQKILKKGLKDFRCISIREKNGADIIKKILPQKTVYSNIDPVFLQRKEMWNKLAGTRRAVKRKYILIYAFEAVKECINIAKKIDSDSRMVRISDAFSKADKDVMNIRGVGPKQFLKLIRDAEFVITDSFHGCAFSIIFEKNFYVIPYEKTTSRMTNLLSMFDLKDRLVVRDISNFENKIDYVKIRKIIEDEINKSDNYLQMIYNN